MHTKVALYLVPDADGLLQQQPTHVRAPVSNPELRRCAGGEAEIDEGELPAGERQFSVSLNSWCMNENVGVVSVPDGRSCS